MSAQDKHQTPFIPAAVDDYGLTPAQFRVLCAIARRGECFETVLGIARRCQLHRRTVWRVLRLLEHKRIIARQIRRGQTSVFRVRPFSDWEPVHEEAPATLDSHACDKRSTGTCDMRGPTEVTPTKLLPLSYSSAQRADPLFVSTWEKWMEYRRGLRNKPKNIEEMFAEQLAWLAGYPNATAIEIIQQSLRNGWQGLFAPRGGGAGLAAASGTRVARPSMNSETHADHAQGF